MSEREIKSGNQKVLFKQTGQGLPLIFLHGWAFPSRKWKKLAGQLADQGFCVYLLFLPGFGRTSPPPKPWSVSDFSEFVLKFAQKQNLKKFFLLGHSFGGRIAIKLAATHSEKLLGLILCGAAGIRPKRGIRYWSFFALAKIGTFLFSFFPLSLFESFARRFLYFLVRERDYYKAKGVMRETMKKVVEEDLTSFLPKIKVPTLIIWGEKDKVVPVSNAYIMGSKVSNSEVVVFKDAGHALPFQKTKELAKIVREFCRSLK